MTACPAILTGEQFLSRLLENIDCQSRLLGSYGYQALGEPGSTASLVVTGLLTLFVALFGLRLLFGPPPGPRDVVFDVLKVGVVLTLAFSWPAFRTVVHDVVLDGPAEIAAELTSTTGSPAGAGMVARLQGVDSAMVRLTEFGTGRNTGQFVDSDDPGSRFAGVALQDGSGFAYGRVVWLAGLLGSMALLRIAAGFLLALAPLAAALLLFEATRGIFSGWLRGLILGLLGTMGVSVVVAIELAVLEPWLTDALRIRSLGYAAPSAPTELLAMTSAFALVQFGMIWVMGRIAWQRGWLSIPAIPTLQLPPAPVLREPVSVTSRAISLNRAERISESVEHLVRQERGESGAARISYRSTGTARDTRETEPVIIRKDSDDRVGSSWRRPGQRVSGAAMRRDGRR